MKQSLNALFLTGFLSVFLISSTAFGHEEGLFDAQRDRGQRIKDTFAHYAFLSCRPCDRDCGKFPDPEPIESWTESLNRLSYGTAKEISNCFLDIEDPKTDLPSLVLEKKCVKSLSVTCSESFFYLGRELAFINKRTAFVFIDTEGTYSYEGLGAKKKTVMVQPHIKNPVRITVKGHSRIYYIPSHNKPSAHGEPPLYCESEDQFQSCQNVSLFFLE